MSPEADELRAFAAKWTAAYRERWATSPYGGPAEPNPSDVEGIVEAFIEAYEERGDHGAATESTPLR